MLPVGAAPGCHLPDDLPTHLPAASLDTGVAGTDTGDMRRAMQQSADLGRHIPPAMYPARSVFMPGSALFACRWCAIG